MRCSRLTHFAISLGLLCAAVSARTQSVPRVGDQQMPVVRATTRMVVVNVVVHDKKGAPVSGLTRDNFTILDGGQKQEISIFSAESGRALRGPVEPLPPNTFSNRVKREGGTPANVAVILLDVLNTPFEDFAFAKKQLIKFLSELQPQDRMALYVLGRKLHLVQDFTSDPAPLLEAVRHEGFALGNFPGSGALNQYPAGRYPELSDAAAAAATQLAIGMADRLHTDSGTPREVEARHIGPDAVRPDWMRQGPEMLVGLLTSDAVQAIANHLAGLPGRKSLIWLTSSVPNPLVYVSPELPPETDPRLGESFARTVHRMNEADVAIYIVDARGLFADPGFKAEFRSYDQGYGLRRMLDLTSVMIEYAERTGGRAFFNTNDIKASLRSALDDCELTYTVGYYPSGARWDGKYHSIKVQVDRPDVQLRHRQGYYADAGAPPVKKDRREPLQEAGAIPLDATALGLTAHLELPNASAKSKFVLTVVISPAGVTFQPVNGARRVSLDGLVGQYSRQGKPLGGDIKTISADLKEQSYEEIVKTGGFKVTFEDNLEPGAAELRVVMRDLSSGSIGSLHIPLDQLVLRSR